jgi:imidazolonepropionase-like amidohydrolase
MMNLKTIAHRYSAAIKACTLLATSLLLAANPAFAQDKSEFVIRDVRIFDGARVIPTGQVWVQSGKIKAVGADVKAPASVRTINGAGQTLLPGLIDAHTHAFMSALKEALPFGVTTELDMFTDHNYAAQIKK